MILGTVALILGFTSDKHIFDSDTIGFLGFFGVVELSSEIIIVLSMVS